MNWYKQAQREGQNMIDVEDVEYESEVFLQDLPPTFQVRIIEDVYTVEELTDKGFKVKYNPVEKLIFIFAKIKYQWAPNELPYRSIVVDLDGNIVSSGFPKFFNYGESQYSEPIDEIFRHAITNQDPELVFTHKYDGTLIIRSVVGKQVMMRTRGTFSGREHGEAAKRIAAEKYPQLLDPEYFPNVSLLFEYIGPENKIVVSYDEEDLILIGAISHDTLQPISWRELTQVDQALRLAETYTLSGKTLDEVKHFLSQYPELIEGLVVRYGPYCCKIKSEDYLRLHRLKSDLTYSKVADIVRNNNINSWEELYSLLQELGWDTEWFKEVRRYYDIYLEKQSLLKNIAQMAGDIVKNIRDDTIEDQRARKADFAKKISQIPTTIKSILFGAYDRKLDEVLYKKEYELEYLHEVIDFLSQLG